MLADYASERGIVLAGDHAGEWSGAAAESIAKIPATGRMRNPIDVGSMRGDWAKVNNVFAAIEPEGLTGPTAVYAHIAPTVQLNEDLARAIIDRKNRTGSPAVVIAPGGLRPQNEELYIQNGVPVFNDIVTAFESLTCHYATLAADDVSRKPLAGGNASKANALLREAAKRSGPSRFLSEFESAAILRAAGVPMVPSEVVGSVADATEAANELGYPIVLKALAPEVAHKNDAGFVIVGIADQATLKEAYATLEARVAANGLQRKDVSFILQPMLRSTAELILGVSREPGLGHFLVLGLGGVYTEVLNEVMLLPVPSSPKAIRTRIEQSKIGALISRIGRGRSDLVDQVEKALLALQELIQSGTEVIESIDVNPLLISADGCTAVDALVVLNKGAYSTTGASQREK
jgi:acyl-CoA synthetase (NDP forming)